MNRIRCLATMLNAYRTALATLRRAPVSIGIATLLLAGEDIVQQALGLTAVNPAEAATNPVLASLFLWKNAAMWLLSLLVIRSAVQDRRRAALWRIDGLALAALALSLLTLVFDQAIAALVGAWAASAAGLPRWAIVSVKLGSVLGLGLLRLRLVELVEPAWRLGDRAVGPLASWRATRGSSLTIFAGILLVTLPLMVAHYALSYALKGGSADPHHLAGMGLDGLLEATIVLVESAFNAVVYRQLRPFARLAPVARALPAIA
jgi:hypothetical protein